MAASAGPSTPAVGQDPLVVRQHPVHGELLGRRVAGLVDVVVHSDGQPATIRGSGRPASSAALRSAGRDVGLDGAGVAHPEDRAGRVACRPPGAAGARGRPPGRESRRRRAAPVARSSPGSPRRRRPRSRPGGARSGPGRTRSVCRPGVAKFEPVHALDHRLVRRSDPEREPTGRAHGVDHGGRPVGLQRRDGRCRSAAPRCPARWSTWPARPTPWRSAGRRRRRWRTRGW